VYRLGDAVVNFYLVDHEDGLTLVDAGLPSHFRQLSTALTHLGRSVDQIRAVLITHGHPDHIGIVEQVRAASDATVVVHAADAPALTKPKSAFTLSKPERSMLPYLLRRPSGLGAPLHMVRSGALRIRPVEHVATLETGRTLDTPGSPLAIDVPGHTRGSVAYLFADRGFVFTGDSLVTSDALTAATGPRLLARGFTHDSAAALASLAALARYEVPLVLPGHGDPYPHGLAEAVELARENGIT
jgi:glyoxylase-like metal-dependent hydrolase (beta-lactamase superfamily II)